MQSFMVLFVRNPAAFTDPCAVVFKTTQVATPAQRVAQWKRRQFMCWLAGKEPYPWLH